MGTPDHFNEIALKFLKFLEDGFLCDTILVTKTKELKAHSILLAAVSPVFRAAFEASSRPGLQYVELTSFDTETVEVALNFIYTGKLLLSSRYTQVENLYRLFGRLKDLGLEAQCLNGCEIRFHASDDDHSKDSPVAKKCASRKRNSTNSSSSASRQNTLTDSTPESFPGNEESAKPSEFHCLENDRNQKLDDLSNPSPADKTSDERLNNFFDVQPSDFSEENISTRDDLENMNNTHKETSDVEVVYTAAADFVHNSLLSNSLTGFNGDCVSNQNDNLLGAVSSESLEGNYYTNSVKCSTEMPDGKIPDADTIKVESDLGQSLDSFVKVETVVDGETPMHQGNYVLSNELTETGHNNSTGSGKQRFSCNICGKLLTKKALKAHSLIHSGERPFECSVCGKTFTMAANLLRHSRLHTGLKPHLCHLCGKAFIQKVTLQDHLATHLSEKRFKCPKCGKMFLKSKHLVEHKHRVHPDDATAEACSSSEDEKCILCDLCGKSFTSKFSLRQHMKLHGSERPYQCNHCDKSFLSKQNLVQHMTNHTGEKPYVCKVCGIAYKRKHLLLWHEHIHTGEKPFVCNVCGKRFAYTCSLKVHVRTHTGERPYECEVCGTAYIQSNHLKVHMRTHTGEKPFACELCGKAYKNRLDLRLHSSRVHHINITKSRSVASNNSWQ